MFDSLDETLKHDLKAQSSPRERMMLYGSVAGVSLLLFGGILAAMKYMG